MNTPGADTFAFSAAPIGDMDGSAETEPMVGGAVGIPDGTALLVVKQGPNAGSRCLLDRSVTSAGRAANSDIVLDDITVSRRHAEFHRHGAAFRVVDVGSLNGTYVNRLAVDTADLVTGDEIRIGKFRLVFLPARARRLR